MAIGEKLWEGKGKTMSMAVNGTSPAGVEIKATWMAQLKGMGMAKGMDGALTFTIRSTLEPSGTGWANGQGLLNFMNGDMAVVKGSSRHKIEMGKAKSVGLMGFMSMNPKLAWMNTATALVTLEGDAAWTEFEVAIWEWK